VWVVSVKQEKILPRLRICEGRIEELLSCKFAKLLSTTPLKAQTCLTEVQGQQGFA